MIGAPSFLSVFMLILASGGGSDLLDFVPTEAYFKAAGIEMTVPALAGVLDAPVPEDAVARPGDSARRQLALRALGELKDPAAMPAIEKALGSDDPFIADYARAARAAIKGEKYRRASVPEEDLAVDLACLPSGAGVIGRLSATGSGAHDLAQLFAVAAIGEEAPDVEEMQMQIVNQLGAIIGKLGNLRLGAITFAVASDVGNDSGFVVLLVRGLYDHEAVRRALGDRIGGVRRRAGGLTFYEIESDTAFACPVSDELFVLMAGPSRDQIPLEEVGAKVAAGGGDFAIGKGLAKMLDGIDSKLPVWALMEVSERYREVPYLAPFDTLKLMGELDGKMTVLKVDAQGKDPEAIAGVVTELNGGLAKARRELAELDEQEEFPGADIAKALLESIEIAADGASASLSARVEAGGAMALMPMMMFGMQKAGPAVPPDFEEAVPEEPGVAPEDPGDAPGGVELEKKALPAPRE